MKNKSSFLRPGNHMVREGKKKRGEGKVCREGRAMKPLKQQLASIPKSPLEEDSVKLGVPSVQVGVLPSTESGGVQVRVRTIGVGPTLVSTPSDDLESGRGSNCTSLTLRTQHHHLLVPEAQTYAHARTRCSSPQVSSTQTLIFCPV